MDDWKCQEVNVLVFYFNPVIKITSNVSKFVVENTYGVNLIPTSDSFSMSAGIAFHLNSYKYKTLELWEYHVVQLFYILFLSLCDLENKRRHTQSETNNAMVCI